MLNNFKWYRKLRGGVWYKYYPDIHGMTTFEYWTQNKDNLAEHEIIIKTEDYGK
jgi:hypothetical protein